MYASAGAGGRECKPRADGRHLVAPGQVMCQVLLAYGNLSTSKASTKGRDKMHKLSLLRCPPPSRAAQPRSGPGQKEKALGNQSSEWLIGEPELVQERQANGTNWNSLQALADRNVGTGCACLLLQMSETSQPPPHACRLIGGRRRGAMLGEVLHVHSETANSAKVV